MAMAWGTGCLSLGRRSRWLFTIRGDDPDGMLRKAAEMAAGRWVSSAGLDVRVVDKGPGDLTVQWVTRDEMAKQANAILPDQPGLSDNVAGGLTVNPSPGVHHILIRNDLGFDRAMSFLTHEMAHAITESGEHSAHGVYSPINYPGTQITEDDLNTVCSYVDCVFAKPEPDPAEQTG